MNISVPLCDRIEKWWQIRGKWLVGGVGGSACWYTYLPTCLPTYLPVYRRRNERVRGVCKFNCRYSDGVLGLRALAYRISASSRVNERCARVARIASVGSVICRRFALSSLRNKCQVNRISRVCVPCRFAHQGARSRVTLKRVTPFFCPLPAVTEFGWIEIFRGADTRASESLHVDKMR